jgi:hypothetical protein
MAGDTLIVYARPDELRPQGATWIYEAFQTMCDGRASLTLTLERWTFPRGLRIGIERLLAAAQHPLSLLSAEECTERAGQLGISERRSCV